MRAQFRMKGYVHAVRGTLRCAKAAKISCGSFSPVPWYSSGVARCWLRSSPFALVASVLVAACFGPTEIRVEITSNASCQDIQTGGTLFFVSPTDHQSDTPVTETHDCHEENGHSTVGSLVLVPSGERTAKLSVEVVTSRRVTVRQGISTGASSRDAG